MADILYTTTSDGIRKRFADNGDGSWSEVVAPIGGGVSADRELVVSLYRVKTSFTGASVGDTISATQIIEVSGTPSTISTIWRNQTTGADLVSAPAAANLELTGSTALTDAQLRATAVAVAPNITRGGGAIDSNTQRVTLASDGPGVAALSSIDTKLGSAPMSRGTGVMDANTLRVTLATDGPTVSNLSSIDAKLGNAANPSATFTRPSDTTAYAIGDLVANSTTAGSVTAMSLTVARAAAGSCMLRRMKLRKSGTSMTSASFRVHLFRSAPSTVTNGDNGAFSVSGVADYLGAFDVTMDRTFTDGAAGFGVPIIGSDITIKLASGTTIAALLEARAAYTPASGETFTVELDDLQN